MTPPSPDGERAKRKRKVVPRSKRKRRLVVIEKGQKFDREQRSTVRHSKGLIEVITIPAAPGGRSQFQQRVAADDESGLVDVVITRDEHSAAPGTGFDLGAMTLSDTALLERTMRRCSIDPTEPNAREQYSRVLTRLEQRKTFGPKIGCSAAHSSIWHARA